MAAPFTSGDSYSFILITELCFTIDPSRPLKIKFPVIARSRATRLRAVALPSSAVACYGGWIGAQAWQSHCIFEKNEIASLSLP